MVIEPPWARSRYRGQPAAEGGVGSTERARVILPGEEGWGRMFLQREASMEVWLPQRGKGLKVTEEETSGDHGGALQPGQGVHSR